MIVWYQGGVYDFDVDRAHASALDLNTIGRHGRNKAHDFRLGSNSHDIDGKNGATARCSRHGNGIFRWIKAQRIRTVIVGADGVVIKLPIDDGRISPGMGETGIIAEIIGDALHHLFGEATIAIDQIELGDGPTIADRPRAPAGRDYPRVTKFGIG